RGARIAEAVRSAGEHALTHLERSLATAVAERETARAARDSGEAEVAEARGRAGRLGAELERLTDTVHRDEVLRAQSRLRVEQLETRIGADFGMGLAELVAEYGPDQDVPPGPEELAEYEAARER